LELIGVMEMKSQKVTACFCRQTKREPVRPPLCTHQKWYQEVRFFYDFKFESCDLILWSVVYMMATGDLYDR
jgi:hypothetical protein